MIFNKLIKRFIYNNLVVKKSSKYNKNINLNTVIIGHNEGDSVRKIIECLPSDWHIVYVADRCTDNTIELLLEYDNVTIINTSRLNLSGRQTSFCRNLGLYFTESDKDVLFLDGDRYVVSRNIRDILNDNSDITLLPLEKDGRNSDSFNIQDTYGTVYNGFFSCGIKIKRDALDKISKHELLYRDNDIPQIFPEELQNVWGIEDTSLGDICYDLGLSIDLDKSIKLYGEFERFLVDSLDVIERRFRFREKLRHIKW